MKYLLILLSLVLGICLPAQADEEELCSRSAIESICEPMVQSAATAMNCYKRAKGFNAGISCTPECKERVVYCIDNEKVNLKKLFEE